MPIRWDDRTPTEIEERDVEAAPVEGASFREVPAAALKARRSWSKEYLDALFRTETLRLFHSSRLGESSQPGESEQQFRARLQLRAREERDAQIEALRTKYAKKIGVLEDRQRKADQKIQVQEEQARSAQVGTLVNIGTAVLGSLFGRKSALRGASTAVKGVSRSLQESGDIRRAREDAEALQGQLAGLRTELESEIEALSGAVDVSGEVSESRVVRPKKANIKVRAVVLVWTPAIVDATGRETR
jgi:hypothetical protein